MDGVNGNQKRKVIVLKKIFLNGNIYTENPEQPHAKAMVTEGKKFIFAGDEETAKAVAPDAEIIDLGGRTVLPGLIDGHTHPSVAGETYWHKIIPATYDRDELLEYIRECAEQNPKEELVLIPSGVSGHIPCRYISMHINLYS